MCSDDYLLHTTCGLMNLIMSELHGVSMLEDPLFVVVLGAKLANILARPPLLNPNTRCTISSPCLALSCAG